MLEGYEWVWLAMKLLVNGRWCSHNRNSAAKKYKFSGSALVKCIGWFELLLFWPEVKDCHNALGKKTVCFRSLRLSPPETSHGVPGLVKLSTNQVVGDLNLTVRSSSSKFLAIFKIVIQSNWNLLDSGTWWPVDYFVDGFASFCHLNCVLHLVSLKKNYTMQQQSQEGVTQL
jgi:hypothetical protein